jgi:hypothetical protein
LFLVSLPGRRVFLVSLPGRRVFLVGLSPRPFAGKLGRQPLEVGLQGGDVRFEGEHQGGRVRERSPLS